VRVEAKLRQHRMCGEEVTHPNGHEGTDSQKGDSIRNRVERVLGMKPLRCGDAPCRSMRATRGPYRCSCDCRVGLCIVLSCADVKEWSRSSSSPGLRR